MKKKYLIAISILLVFASLVLSGCKKDFSDAQRISFNFYETLPDIQEILKAEKLTSVDFSQFEVEKNYIDQILEKFPDCDIKWNIPFSFGTISSDEKEIISSEITNDDVSLLSYMTHLEKVDASGSVGCQSLGEYAKSNPNVEVTYPISICGKTYNVSDELIDLQNESISFDDLKEKLYYFSSPLSVNLIGVELSKEQMVELKTLYPDFEFFWIINMFGQEFKSTDTKIDLNFVNINTFEDIETLVRCLNHPEYVDLARQGFSSRDMIKLSNTFLDTKFVWMVSIGKMYIRTDITSFDISNAGKGLGDEDIQNLAYCTWLQAVNLSDSKITNLNVLSVLPNLKYLVAYNTNLEDVTAISEIPSLQYVDLHNNNISDVSAFRASSEITDLNLSENKISDFSPLKGCTNLKVGILSSNPASEDFDQVNALINTLPNCTLDFENKTDNSIWNSTEKSIEVNRFLTARSVSESSETNEEDESDGIIEDEDLSDSSEIISDDELSALEQE